MKQYTKLFLNMCFLLMMSISAKAMNDEDDFSSESSPKPAQMFLMAQDSIGKEKPKGLVAHFHITKKSKVHGAICNLSVSFKSTKQKRPNAKNFKCVVCGREYVRKDFYIKHLATHPSLPVAEEPCLSPILIDPSKDSDTTKTTNGPAPSPCESNLGFKKSQKKPEEIEPWEYLETMFPGEEVSGFVFTLKPQDDDDFAK